MPENIVVSPKLDVVFRMLFGEQKNENITKGLLKDVLGEEINSVDLKQNLSLIRKTNKR